MKKMKKWYILGACLVVALGCMTLFGCGSSSSDSGDSGDVTTLKLTSDHTAGQFMIDVEEEFAKEIEEKTDGRYKIDVNTAAALGDYSTTYPEIARGTIQIGFIPIPDTMDIKFTANSVPYICEDYDQIATMYDENHTLGTVLGKLHEENGVEFKGYCVEGFIGVGSTKEIKDFATPGTDKGVKLRVWANVAVQKGCEAMGYHNTTIPWSDMLTSMQTGVIDAQTGTNPRANYDLLSDVEDYYYVDHMLIENCSIIFNKEFYDGLSDEDKAIFDEAAANARQKSIELSEKEDQKALADLEAKGVKVITMNEKQIAERAAFIRENVWPDLAKEYGDELMGGLIKDAAELSK